MNSMRKILFFCSISMGSAFMYGAEWSDIKREPASPCDVERTGGGYTILPELLKQLRQLRIECTKKEEENAQLRQGLLRSRKDFAAQTKVSTDDKETQTAPKSLMVAVQTDIGIPADQMQKESSDDASVLRESFLERNRFYLMIAGTTFIVGGLSYLVYKKLRSNNPHQRISFIKISCI